MSASIEVEYSAIWSADAHGICTAVQEHPVGLIPTLKGTTLKAWLGTVQAENDGQLATELAAALDYVMPFHLEIPIQCIDGKRRQLVVSGLPHGQPGSPHSYQGFILDVTAQRKALANALRTAAEYRVLVENTTDLIAHCDTDGRYIAISPSYSEMIGWSADELVGQPVIDFLHPDDRLPSAKALNHVFGGNVLPDVVEVRKQHRDGRYVMLGTKACAVIDLSTGSVTGAVLVSRDITREKEKLKSLEKMATSDELTGLPNRAWIFEQVSRMLAKHQGQTHTTVLFIDLNGFKSVNDSLGHAAGDVLLQQISKRLTHCMRPGETVARLGGDEFVVAAWCSDRESACAIAQRIRNGLSRPFVVDGLAVQIGASIGISMARAEMSSAVLFKNADSAMYRAKARGHDSYEFFGGE